MDQAGHVIPAAQIQPEDVVAQVVEELLHLKGHRMRLDQRHALDVIAGAKPLAVASRLKHVAPPQRLVGRLGLGNVDRERMLEPRRARRCARSSARSNSDAEVSSRRDTPAWLRCRPRTRIQVTVALGLMPTRPPALRVVVGQRPVQAPRGCSPDPAAECAHSLAIESSRSSITPGAPELSILTTSSASSAGPVI